jgi:hypothetical protein
MMGRWIDDDDTHAPARVGEIGTLDAMLMNPAAISAELARIDQAFHAFNTDVAASVVKHGLPANLVVAGVLDWLKDLGKSIAEVAVPSIGPTIAVRDAAKATPPNDFWKNVAQGAQAAALPAATANNTDPVVRFYVDTWVPIYQTWQAFYAKEKDGAWFHNAAYDGEKYLDQLKQLREHAKAIGIVLNSADPSSEHASSSWLALAKYGLIGAGVLGGLWVVSKFVRKDG